MSHSTMAKKNKQQKQSKVQTDQYLYNPGEPRDEVSNYLPSELEYALLEDTTFIRGRLRRDAQRLRKHYI